jgi:hypothetical protein
MVRGILYSSPCHLATVRVPRLEGLLGGVGKGRADSYLMADFRKVDGDGFRGCAGGVAQGECLGKHRLLKNIASRSAGQK